MNSVKGNGKIVGFAIAIIITTLTIGCREEGNLPARREGLGFDSWFRLHLGETVLQVQLAVTPEEKAKGLMFREELAEGHGMLFAFQNPGPQRFWMRNTRIPLDIGYFSPDGVLKEIHAAQPFDESGCPSRSDNIKIVLELNQGAFRAAKQSPGAKLNLNDIALALEKRGFSSQQFGIKTSQTASEASE
jgi:uncharacterized membrane protein (UPF0127 family)